MGENDWLIVPQLESGASPSWWYICGFLFRSVCPSFDFASFPFCRGPRLLVLLKYSRGTVIKKKVKFGLKHYPITGF